MNFPSTCFVPIRETHLSKVLEWRNQPRIRRNMVSSGLITADEHRQWFAGLEYDVTRLYAVFLQDLRPIGMLYFTKITKASCSWGCYIGEEAVWPGSGLILEVAALDYAFKILKTEILNANVFEFNKQPQSMHRLFMYQCDRADDTQIEHDGSSQTLIRYWYEKNAWLRNRSIVVNRLPRKIQCATEKICFDKSLLSL